MGLLRGVARTAVVAGTATAVSNRVSRRQAGRWAAQEQPQPQRGYDAEPQRGYDAYEGGAAYSAPGQMPAAGAPPGASDTDRRLAQLKDLGELRAQGLLTEAEFEEQKARILGS
jgi:hypothetical protein